MELERLIGMPYIGLFLVVFIVLSVCVYIWMLIRCIQGVREAYFDTKENIG